MSQNLLKVYELYFEGELASQAYLIESEKEDFLVNFINDKKFSKYNLSSIILDQIFRKNIEKKILTFMEVIFLKLQNFIGVLAQQKKITLS